MSARNSRAAKAARRTARQARTSLGGFSRSRIAGAVHEAVCTVGRDQGVGHCDAYAWAGAVVLSVLSGERWFPQGGEAGFGTGIDRDSPEGEVCFVWQPSATTAVVAPNGMTGGGGLANGELHAWCAMEQDGKVAEVADFAARHVPALARLSGIGWQREDLPYVWGTPAQLHAQRFWYRPEPSATEFVNNVYAGNTSSFEDVAVLALWRLGVHGDRQAERLIHDRKLLDLMRDGYTITESLPGGFIAVRAGLAADMDIAKGKEAS